MKKNYYTENVDDYCMLIPFLAVKLLNLDLSLECLYYHKYYVLNNYTNFVFKLKPPFLLGNFIYVIFCKLLYIEIKIQTSSF